MDANNAIPTYSGRESANSSYNHSLVPSTRPTGGHQYGHHSVTSSPAARDPYAAPISQSYDSGARRGGGAASIRGVGLMLVEDSNGLVRVSGLAPDGPAARSGQIRVNDVVQEVDGKNIRGQPLASFASMISGPEGTYVRIGIQSEFDNFVRRVTLQRTSPVNSSAPPSRGSSQEPPLDRSGRTGRMSGAGPSNVTRDPSTKHEPPYALGDQLCGIGIRFGFSFLPLAHVGTVSEPTTPTATA